MAGLVQWAVGLAVGVVVAVRGVRKHSLSRSGGVAAAAVGALTLGAGPVWGAVLLAFYFTGSAATRHKAAVKAALDMEVRGGGGERDAAQVAATAGVGAAVVAAYCTLWGWAAPPPPQLVVPWGRAAAGPEPDAARTGVGSALFIAYLANFAMVAGDTWASELGILARGRPVLVTPLLCCRVRRVPPGTNGGVTAWGTAMSAAGGCFMGVVAMATLAVQAAAGGGGSVPSLATAAVGVALATAAGVVGSALDSVVGAVAQRTWVHRDTGKATSRLLPVPAAVADAAPPMPLDAAPASALTRRRGAGATDAVPAPPPPPPPPLEAAYDVVCGYDVLSNEAVNFLASAATAALAVWVTR